MGWGLTIKPEIYLSRINKSEIDSKLEDVTEDIQVARDTIFSLVSGGSPSVRNQGTDDEQLPHEYLPREFNELFKDLTDNILLQYQLQLAKENLETATGE